jgi:hypothetical protein
MNAKAWRLTRLMRIGVPWVNRGLTPEFLNVPMTSPASVARTATAIIHRRVVICGRRKLAMNHWPVRVKAIAAASRVRRPLAAAGHQTRHSPAVVAGRITVVLIVLPVKLLETTLTSVSSYIVLYATSPFPIPPKEYDLASTTQLMAATSIAMTDAANISHRTVKRNCDGRMVVNSVVQKVHIDLYIAYYSLAVPSNASARYHAFLDVRTAAYHGPQEATVHEAEHDAHLSVAS